MIYFLDVCYLINDLSKRFYRKDDKRIFFVTKIFKVIRQVVLMFLIYKLSIPESK
jgi:hypothetical protein